MPDTVRHGLPAFVHGAAGVASGPFGLDQELVMQRVSAAAPAGPMAGLIMA
jgi:hypothetical protein